MLDVVTMRVLFALIALCMLGLFYVTTYRTTRAPFCGWWCLALALFLLAAVAWLFNGTGAQVLANPLGNVFGVCGATTVWLAARSLERRRPSWGVLAILPGLTAIAGALGDPGHDTWSGGLVFLASMTVGFGLATREIGLAWRTALVPRSTISSVDASLAATSALAALFYLGRTLAFATVGPDHPVFLHIFGTTPTTLLATLMLVTVSHSMGALSQEQLVQDLRQSAERDDLTGLLNRHAFWRLAAETTRGIGDSAVVVADLDHFKRINDDYGHAVGDEVLTTFADAVRETTRSTDLAARFGGEEFVILMPGAGIPQAEAMTRGVSRIMRESVLFSDGEAVTVSYGIAILEAGVSLDLTIEQADAALYQAKEAGRDQTVAHDEGTDEPSPTRRPSGEPT